MGYRVNNLGRITGHGLTGQCVRSGSLTRFSSFNSLHVFIALLIAVSGILQSTVCLTCHYFADITEHILNYRESVVLDRNGPYPSPYYGYTVRAQRSPYRPGARPQKFEASAPPEP